MNLPGAPSMSRFFQIPELVRITCSYGESVDNARLALTCRTLYSSAISVAWDTVLGVSQLLLLLEGAKCISCAASKGELIELELPDNLSEKITSRFNFYGKFVTSLEIFKHENQRILISNPQKLVKFACSRELLPNLKQLTLTTLWTRQLNSIFWVNIFASKSLVDLWIPALQNCETIFISDISASALTDALQRLCPGIQRIAFFSHHSSPADDEENPLDKNFVHDGIDTHISLAQFTSLTTLTGSISLLESPALLALGSLPALRDLTIHYPPDDISEPGPTTLPPGSFPKLDTLTLCSVVENTAEFIWTMPCLVTQLRSLTINFEPPYHDDEDDDSDDDETGWILHSLIPLICTQSPHIQELELEFNYSLFEAGQDRYICDFTETALDALSKLKLVRFELLHARISDEACVERLINAWPEIEILRWTHQPIKVTELPRFLKQLPRLRQLALSIDSNVSPSAFDINAPAEITHQALRIFQSDFCGLGNLNHYYAVLLLIYLKRLVPHVKLEPLPNAYDEAEVRPSRKLDLGCMFAINLMGAFFEMDRRPSPEQSELLPGTWVTIAEVRAACEGVSTWMTVQDYIRKEMQEKEQGNPKRSTSEERPAE